MLPAPTSVKFVTPDSAIVAEDQRWGYDELAARIDLATGKRTPLPGKLGALKSLVPLAIAPDGKRIVTLQQDRKQPALDVWSWPKGEPLRHVPLKPPGKLALAYCTAAYVAPNGRQLVAVMCYEDANGLLAMQRLPAQPFVERWDLMAGKLIERFAQSANRPPHLLRYRDGVLLWSADAEVRDVVTRKLVAELEIPKNEGIMLAETRAALSPDGKRLAIGEISGRDGGHRVFVFDVGTGKLAAGSPCRRQVAATCTAWRFCPTAGWSRSATRPSSGPPPRADPDGDMRSLPVAPLPHASGSIPIARSCAARRSARCWA